MAAVTDHIHWAPLVPLNSLMLGIFLGPQDGKKTFLSSHRSSAEVCFSSRPHICTSDTDYGGSSPKNVNSGWAVS